MPKCPANILKGEAIIRRRKRMNLSNVPQLSHIPPGPVAALVAGILVLLFPRLLNYVVAIYLIVIGILGLVHGSWW